MSEEELPLVNDWDRANLPEIGARQKAWYLHPVSRRQGLVKVARRQVQGVDHLVEGELVGEYVSSRLGATLGFDVAEVEPVLYKIDEYLVRQQGDRRHELVSPVMEVCPISWSFLTTGEQLIHGAALTDTETELRENSNKLVQLTVDRILEALSNKLEKEEARRYLAELILFDILIGNTDRHQQNWGIIKCKSGFRPAPMFDNGAAFGCCLPVSKLESYDYERFNARFSHEFSVSADPLKNSTIQQLLQRCKSEDLLPAARNVCQRLENFDVESVWRALHPRVLREETKRLEFAKGLVNSRRILILDALCD